MKKVIGRAIIAGMLTLVGMVAFSIYDKHAEKAELIEQIQYLPQIAVTSTDGSQHILRGNGLPTLMVYYSSECQFCLDEFAQIREVVSTDSMANYIFLSAESLEKINSFSSLINLSHYPGVRFFRVEAETVLRIFGSFAAPQNLVYNGKEKLTFNRKGPIRAQELKTLLHE